MNKWTLRFHSNHLEQSFNEYYASKSRPKIIFMIYIHWLLCFIATGVEFSRSHIAMGSFYFGFGFASFLISIAIWKYNYDIIKLFPIFNTIGLIVPYVSIYFIVESGMEASDQIVLMLLINMFVHYIQTVQQSYIVHAIQHVNMCVLTILVCYSALGYTYFYIIYGIFNLAWFKIDYHNVQDQRKLFQESKVNESLDDIVTRVINDKLVVYTYNTTYVRYDCQYISNSMLNFIQSIVPELESPQKTLLYDTKIYLNKVPHTLSDYLFQFTSEDHKYHLSQNTIELDGFYQQRQNKILIQIDFQTSQQLSFIVKFDEKQKSNVSMKKQVQFLQAFQLLTQQTFNKISKLIQESTQAELKMSQIKDLMQYHNVKMQITNIKFSNNNSISRISNFNLNTIINNSMWQTCCLYEILGDNYQVQSDYNQIYLLLQVVARYLKQIVIQKHKVEITLIGKENQIFVNFEYKQLRQKQKTTDQCRKFMTILLSKIGNIETLQISNNKLFFVLHTDLELNFEFDNLQ